MVTESGKIKTHHEPHFLNVDLEVVSATPFKALPECWGEEVFLLYNGDYREGKYLAAAEVSVMSDDPDGVINKFCNLIERHNAEAIQEWQSAESRTLDIGIDSGVSRQKKCNILKLNLKPETVTRISALSISLTISVYPLRLKKKGSRNLRLMYP